VGLAFHVGSQCLVPSAFRNALKIVGETMEAAKTPLQMLDVGGGFPAHYVGIDTPPLEDFMAAIETGVKDLKLRRDCVLMCEPGRALVAHGVHHRPGPAAQGQPALYQRRYLRFVRRNGLRQDQGSGPDGAPEKRIDIGARILRPQRPTCDSLDVLPGTFELPGDIEDGDWIEIDRMGAYSNATATHFNGFYPDTLVVTTISRWPLPDPSSGAASPHIGQGEAGQRRQNDDPPAMARHPGSSATASQTQSGARTVSRSDIAPPPPRAAIWRRQIEQ